MIVEVDGRPIEVGNPDKVLFPADGITKAEIVEHYHRLAPVMLPHLRGRPLTLERYPDGIDAEGFYQKEASGHFPNWIRRVTVPKRDGEVNHVVSDDAATLVYLAEQATITPHCWLSTADHPDRPDRLVLDLDPPADSHDVQPVRAAARSVRDLLDHLGLASRLMTTGSKGFHVVVPLAPEAEFDRVRRFAQACAELLAAHHPGQLTTETRISERGGRVFVDYLRNGYAQTTVAPYALRARLGAPVATPIDWDELGRTDPRSYTLRNIRRRLGQKDDPWVTDGVEGQTLDEAEQRLAGMDPR